MPIKINIEIPTSWNALSKKQLENISYNLEKYQDAEQEEQNDDNFKKRFYFQLIKELLRGNNFLKIRYAIAQVPPETYKETVNFIVQNVKRTIFPSTLNIKGFSFNPPAEKLKNITIKEFSFADSLFYNWREKKDTRYLDLLCATLYRKPVNNSIDNRIPFNKIEVENQVALFKKIPFKTKLSIGYTYMGCRNYIADLYPHVFPKPIKTATPEGEVQEKKKPEYTPFGKLIQFKVGFDPSKLDQAQNLNINEFLSIYENELIEIKKQKS